MNNQDTQSLENELSVAKLNNHQLIAHCSYLTSFLYELKDAFLHNAPLYEKKAEKILSQTPKQSLEIHDAELIKRIKGND